MRAACRRGRVEEGNVELRKPTTHEDGPRPEPVAICRLKRVAADHKDDITPFLPKAPKQKNGKRIAASAAARRR